MSKFTHVREQKYCKRSGDRRHRVQASGIRVYLASSRCTASQFSLREEEKESD